MAKPTPLTYANSGVDINAGDALVERIAPLARLTMRSGSLDGLGGFGGLFDPRAAGYRDPILVAAADGVGTKLRLAIEADDLTTIGIDCVAMCVNDLVCQGAEPLFFLDYYATGKLDVARAEQVVKGIADACKEAGCALLGGETAEMPGHYRGRDFDLAGFAVGAVERGEARPSGIAEGDILLGLGSAGLHSNGFSLVRRIIERDNLDLGETAPFCDGKLSHALLRPTRLYPRAVLAALRAGGVAGAAHITGGGLSGNLPRILPVDLGAEILLEAWDLPPVFRWVAEASALEPDEMLATFNCGIGMVLVVKEESAEAVIELLRSHDETVHAIGRVVPGAGVRFDGALM
jgi:phosphoribosylformylglycinamidine cyclo-ligase